MSNSQIIKKILSLFEEIDFNSINQYKIVNKEYGSLIKLKNKNNNILSNIEVIIGNCTICLTYEDFIVVVCPDQKCLDIVSENSDFICKAILDYNLYMNMFELFDGTIRINSYIYLINNIK